MWIGPPTARARGPCKKKQPRDLDLFAAKLVKKLGPPAGFESGTNRSTAARASLHLFGEPPPLNLVAASKSMPSTFHREPQATSLGPSFALFVSVNMRGLIARGDVGGLEISQCNGSACAHSMV